MATAQQPAAKQAAIGVLFTSLLAGAPPQAIPTAPGVYYESAGELKPLGTWPARDEDQVVLPRQLPPLVIVFPKDAVHIEGLRLGTLSDLTFTIGTGGSGISFARLTAPKRTESVSGRPNAFRVTFDDLFPESYLVVSEFVDKADGKKKTTIHAGFLVK